MTVHLVVAALIADVEVVDAGSAIGAGIVEFVGSVSHDVHAGFGVDVAVRVEVFGGLDVLETLIVCYPRYHSRPPGQMWE